MSRPLRHTGVFLLALLMTACATDTIEDRRRGQQVLCHEGEKTLTLSNASAHDHFQHGDQPGPCPDDVLTSPD